MGNAKRKLNRAGLCFMCGKRLVGIGHQTRPGTYKCPECKAADIETDWAPVVEKTREELIKEGY